MKYLLFLLLSITNACDAVSQQSTTYFLSFIYTENAIDNSVVDSITKIYGDTTDTTVKIIGDTTYKALLADVLKNLGTLSFKAPAFMIANSDSSKTFFRLGDTKPAVDDHPLDGNVNLQISISMPDTQFYKNGKWITLREGAKEVMPTFRLVFQEKNSTKEILGFTCQKFVHETDAGEPGIIVWACKSLPDTILPFVGLEHFNWGILEIENISERWHVKATEIRVLK